MDAGCDQLGNGLDFKVYFASNAIYVAGNRLSVWRMLHCNVLVCYNPSLGVHSETIETRGPRLARSVCTTAKS
eukprot:1040469-Rhodomonas_salina.2